MNIAIYKPYKKVFFNDDKDDLSAVSYEVVNLAKILAKNGHNISIISDTDLLEPTREGIKNGDINSIYDRIIIFSGTFSKDKYGNNIIDKLRNQTQRLDFYLTDLRLTPNSYEKFDNIYTQATSKLNIGKDNKYGGVAELRCFEQAIHDNPDKTILYGFNGTERGRLDTFLEYVWRPDCQITGKSDTLKFDNRVTRDIFLETLSKTKYSIIIADDEYDKNSFITPRPYEHILNGIISFFHITYDKDRYFEIPEYLRVSSYKELRNKINELEENIALYDLIKNQQNKLIKQEYIDGSYIYNLIK